LPENFSERVKGNCEIALQGSCQQGSWQSATSSGRSTPDMYQPFGENAVGQIIGWM
jgi:hypothetical protein